MELICKSCGDTFEVEEFDKWSKSCFHCKDGELIVSALTLEEAKKLFEKNHPDVAGQLKKPYAKLTYEFAACWWNGFKSALKITGQLED